MAFQITRVPPATVQLPDSFEGSLTVPLYTIESNDVYTLESLACHFSAGGNGLNDNSYIFCVWVDPSGYTVAKSMLFFRTAD